MKLFSLLFHFFLIFHLLASSIAECLLYSQSNVDEKLVPYQPHALIVSGRVYQSTQKAIEYFKQLLTQKILKELYVSLHPQLFSSIPSKLDFIKNHSIVEYQTLFSNEDFFSSWLDEVKNLDRYQLTSPEDQLLSALTAALQNKQLIGQKHFLSYYDEVLDHWKQLYFPQNQLKSEHNYFTLNQKHQRFSQQWQQLIQFYQYQQNQGDEAFDAPKVPTPVGSASTGEGANESVVSELDNPQTCVLVFPQDASGKLIPGSSPIQQCLKPEAQARGQFKLSTDTSKKAVDWLSPDRYFETTTLTGAASERVIFEIEPDIRAQLETELRTQLQQRYPTKKAAEIESLFQGQIDAYIKKNLRTRVNSQVSIFQNTERSRIQMEEQLRADLNKQRSLIDVNKAGGLTAAEINAIQENLKISFGGSVPPQELEKQKAIALKLKQQNYVNSQMNKVLDDKIKAEAMKGSASGFDQYVKTRNQILNTGYQTPSFNPCGGATQVLGVSKDGKQFMCQYNGADPNKTGKTFVMQQDESFPVQKGQMPRFKSAIDPTSPCAKIPGATSSMSSLQGDSFYCGQGEDKAVVMDFNPGSGKWAPRVIDERRMEQLRQRNQELMTDNNRLNQFDGLNGAKKIVFAPYDIPFYSDTGENYKSNEVNYQEMTQASSANADDYQSKSTIESREADKRQLGGVKCKRVPGKFWLRKGEPLKYDAAQWRNECFRMFVLEPLIGTRPTQFDQRLLGKGNLICDVRQSPYGGSFRKANNPPGAKECIENAGKYNCMYKDRAGAFSIENEELKLDDFLTANRKCAKRGDFSPLIDANSEMVLHDGACNFYRYDPESCCAEVVSNFGAYKDENKECKKKFNEHKNTVASKANSLTGIGPYGLASHAILQKEKKDFIDNILGFDLKECVGKGTADPVKHLECGADLAEQLAMRTALAGMALIGLGAYMLYQCSQEGKEKDPKKEGESSNSILGLGAMMVGLPMLMGMLNSNNSKSSSGEDPMLQKLRDRDKDKSGDPDKQASQKVETQSANGKRPASTPQNSGQDCQSMTNQTERDNCLKSQTLNQIDRTVRQVNDQNQK